MIASNPKLIVIGTSTPSIEDDAKFAKAIKDQLPESIVCFCGTHASSTAIETLENYPWVDLIARREYDLTVLEVLERILEGKKYSDCLGISTRVNGVIVETPNRDYIENLDVLPFASKVYKKHLTIKNYYYGHVKYPMISILARAGRKKNNSYIIYS